MQTPKQRKDGFSAKAQAVFDKYVTLARVLPKRSQASECALTSKSELCKHEHACLEHIFKSSVKSFLQGCLVALALELVQLITKRKRGGARILHILREIAAFGLFPFVYTAALKSVHCAGRRVLKRESGGTAFVAGFLGGFLAMLCKNSANRSQWSLFLLARAVDCVYRSLVRRHDTKSRLFKEVDYLLIFSALNSLTGYAYAVEPGIISRGLFNFYKFFANQNLMDKIMCHMWVEGKNRDLAKFGIEGFDPSKYWKLEF